MISSQQKKQRSKDDAAKICPAWDTARVLYMRNNLALKFIAYWLGGHEGMPEHFTHLLDAGRTMLKDWG